MPKLGVKEVSNHALERAAKTDTVFISGVWLSITTMLAVLGVHPLFFFCGAASWIIGVVLKGVLLFPWYTAGRSPTHDLVQSIATGLLSAISEIGTAAIIAWAVFANPEPTDLIAYGVGAAIIEGLLLFYEGTVDQPASEAVANWERAAKKSFVIRHAMAVERLASLFLHVGARSFAAFGAITGSTIPFLISIIAFSLVDGIAEIGERKGVNWYSKRVFFLYFGLPVFLGSPMVLALVILS